MTFVITVNKLGGGQVDWGDGTLQEFLAIDPEIRHLYPQPIHDRIMDTPDTIEYITDDEYVNDFEISGSVLKGLVQL